MLQNQVRSWHYYVLSELSPSGSESAPAQVQNPKYLQVFLILPILNLKEGAFALVKPSSKPLNHLSA